MGALPDFGLASNFNDDCSLAMSGFSLSYNGATQTDIDSDIWCHTYTVRGNEDDWECLNDYAWDADGRWVVDTVLLEVCPFATESESAVEDLFKKNKKGGDSKWRASNYGVHSFGIDNRHIDAELDSNGEFEQSFEICLKGVNETIPANYCFQLADDAGTELCSELETVRVPDLCNDDYQCDDAYFNTVPYIVRPGQSTKAPFYDLEWLGPEGQCLVLDGIPVWIYAHSQSFSDMTIRLEMTHIHESVVASDGSDVIYDGTCQHSGDMLAFFVSEAICPFVQSMWQPFWDTGDFTPPHWHSHLLNDEFPIPRCMACSDDEHCIDDRRFGGSSYIPAYKECYCETGISPDDGEDVLFFDDILESVPFPGVTVSQGASCFSSVPLDSDKYIWLEVENTNADRIHHCVNGYVYWNEMADEPTYWFLRYFAVKEVHVSDSTYSGGEGQHPCYHDLW